MGDVGVEEGGEMEAEWAMEMRVMCVCARSVNERCDVWGMVDGVWEGQAKDAAAVGGWG